VNDPGNGPSMARHRRLARCRDHLLFTTGVHENDDADPLGGCTGYHRVNIIPILSDEDEVEIEP